jgi:protein TonB
LPIVSSDAAQPSAAASATQPTAPALNSSSATPAAAAPSPAVPAPQPASTADAAQNSNAKEKPASLLSASKRTPLRPSTDSVPASTTLLLEAGPIVPPKLVKSVRPNAPRDAILGYVTGDVAVDATVDPSGRVSSAKVLSGPASLRNAAVKAVKQYRYDPATQNGKPVSAHVNVTIQFWFEP